MHSCFLATFNREHAQNSSEARIHILKFLEEHTKVYSEGEETYGPYTDYKKVVSGAEWYRVGGRWNGVLIVENDLFWKALERRGLTKPSYFDPSDTTLKEDADKTEIQKAWEEVGGRGISPVTEGIRIPIDGQEHDAMIVDDNIYDKFLACYEGKNEYAMDGMGDEHPNFADLDEDLVSRDFVGKKWIVVVDYHF